MTTPAAAPAAPAAAPAAPAPATAPAPAAPAAAPPAAPAAAPAAPPAAAPAPAAPAASDDSLLPPDPAAPAPAAQTPEEKLAAARSLIKEADAAADPNSGKAWLLHDGVMGAGEKPGWFKQEKYKTVSAQAEAYVALEGRFGAFKGAPKNEKGETAYVFTPPEGVEFKADHPMAQAFQQWAGANQLSQEGYNELLGQLVQYELAQAPDMSKVKAELGDNADARITTVAQWGKANLGNEGYALLRSATSGKEAASVFKVLEQVIAKTAQIRMPKPGADVPGATGGGEGLAAIKAAHGAKVDGKLRVNVDPSYRLEIEKRYRDFYAGVQQ